MKIIKKIIFLLALTAQCAVAAQNNIVHVEVIVFETKTQDHNTSQETWPNHATAKKPAFNQALSLQASPTAQFGPLSEKQFVLTNAKKRLQQRYRVVLHQGWRQPLADKMHTPGVRLIGGKPTSNEASGHEVEGVIKVIGGNLLSLDADLFFQKAHQGFHLKEKARLKINEIHYVDHPLYGMIVMVTREKQAKIDS